ncbi:MAG: GNAT family N-acetyltransferase [Cyclobacteriaceae bacterium]
MDTSIQNSPLEIDWKFCKLEGIKEDDMLALFKLRAKVSIINDSPPTAIDLNGVDKEATHVMGISNDRIIAYCMICPPGVQREETTISRIIVDTTFRGQGIGDKLVNLSIDYIKKNWKSNVVVSAQAYLQVFFRKHNFETISDEYPLGLVSHVDMVCQLP